MARVVVHGAQELQRAIQRLVKNVDEPVRALLPGAEVLASGVRNKIREQDLIETGNLIASVIATEVNKNTALLREGPLPYVFAQEFGLARQVITDRQRRFFWARYRETGDGMWKALALSETYTIPAKPHFRPGVKDSQVDAINAIAEAMTALILR